jgi:hypothetical protein
MSAPTPECSEPGQLYAFDIGTSETVYCQLPPDHIGRHIWREKDGPCSVHWLRLPQPGPEAPTLEVRIVVVRRGENVNGLFDPHSRCNNGGAFNPMWRQSEADGPRIPDEEIPSLRLPDDVALALLEGLLEHYRGGHDARQLRADYQDERKRVDKLMDAMVSLVRQNG